MRPSIDSTQVIPQPTWQNPRVHLLDDFWLMTIIAVVISTGVPWLASGFDIDVLAATSGLLGIGVIYLALSAIASPSRIPPRWAARALTLFDVAGVVLLGFVWQHVGGLQNPMFLTVYALPVIGSIFISRWHPYLIASVAILVVATGALVQAPELRWYLSGLVGNDALITSLFGSPRAATQHSFSGFYAPSSYLIVMLEVFAVVLLGCAAAAEYIATLFERLSALSARARLEAQRGQELWVDLIEQLPLAALLIDPHTMGIVASSGWAVRYAIDKDQPLNGRPLFEALRFSYPDSVHELIVGAGGGSPTATIRVDEQLRLTKLRVLHLAHQGHRLALLSIEDTTEVFCLSAALDSSEFAALVVDSRGRVLAFNKLAVVLFGGLQVGTDTSQLLAQPLTDQRFWDPGLTGRRKMHVEINSRVYQASSAAIALPGEEERVFSMSFLPVARGAEPRDTDSTVLTATMRQLR